jgi:hypothetical protein
MVISGIILYFAPPGRVANWSNWTFLGLLKSQWQSIHTIFTFIFVVAAGFHLFYNWKPFLAYLKSKFEAKVKLRQELILSSILVIILLFMTIYNFAPFSTVMEFGDQLKESWSSESTEPPIPHAENLTITEFAKTINIPIDELKEKLSSKNIIITQDDITIKKLAELNNISPNKIYNTLIKPVAPGSTSTAEGRGYGRKTLEDICFDNNITINAALKNLQAEGIEAVGTEKLKDIAIRNNLLPIDIANKAIGIKKSPDNI